MEDVEDVEDDAALPERLRPPAELVWRKFKAVPACVVAADLHGSVSSPELEIGFVWM